MALGYVVVRASGSLYGAAPSLPPVGTTSLTNEMTAAIAAYVHDEAQKMRAARSAEDQVAARMEVVDTVGPKSGASAIFKDSYATAVDYEFSKLLATPNTSLNAVLTIQGMQHFGTDRSLETALANADPAVRYWGGKGLAQIINDLKTLPASYDRALTALKQQAGKDGSSAAAAQMVEALRSAAAGTGGLTSKPAADALNDAEALRAKLLHGQAPSDPASEAFMTTALGDLVRAGLLTDNKQAANSLAAIGSAEAHYYNLGAFSSEQKHAVVEAIKSAIESAGQAAGGTVTITFDDNSDPADVLGEVLDIVGTPGHPGKLKVTPPAPPAALVENPGGAGAGTQAAH